MRVAPFKLKTIDSILIRTPLMSSNKTRAPHPTALSRAFYWNLNSAFSKWTCCSWKLAKISKFSSFWENHSNSRLQEFLKSQRQILWSSCEFVIFKKSFVKLTQICVQGISNWCESWKIFRLCCISHLYREDEWRVSHPLSCCMSAA